MNCRHGTQGYGVTMGFSNAKGLLRRQLVQGDPEGLCQSAQCRDGALLAPGLDLGDRDTVHTGFFGQGSLGKTTQIAVDTQRALTVQKSVRVVCWDQLVLARSQTGHGAVIGLKVSQIFGRSAQAVVFVAGDCHHLAHVNALSVADSAARSDIQYGKDIALRRPARPRRSAQAGEAGKARRRQLALTLFELRTVRHPRVQGAESHCSLCF